MKQIKGETPPIYLGDGLYASYEPQLGLIWLRTARFCTRRDEHGQYIHEVALDYETFPALLSYKDAISDRDETPGT